MPTPASRRLTVLASATIALLALSGCAAGADAADTAEKPETPAAEAAAFDLLPQEFQDSGVIRVAMASTAPPFSSMAAGEWSGLIPELAEAVEPHLGVELEIIDTAYPSQMAALQAGKVDMIWGATGDTPAREEVLDLVSFMRSSAVPMVLKKNDVTLEDESDLCGLTVGTISGGDLQKYLENKAQECEAAGDPMDARLYDTSSGATAQLQSGQIDALLGIEMIQRFAAQALQNGEVFEVKDVHVVPTIYGIGFEKGSTELEEAFIVAVQHAIEDGSYSKVFQAYGAETSELTPDEVMVNGVGAGKL